jgi:hypothetical protein
MRWTPLLGCRKKTFTKCQHWAHRLLSLQDRELNELLVFINYTVFCRGNRRYASHLPLFQSSPTEMLRWLSNANIEQATFILGRHHWILKCHTTLPCSKFSFPHEGKSNGPGPTSSGQGPSITLLKHSSPHTTQLARWCKIQDVGLVWDRNLTSHVLQLRLLRALLWSQALG